MTLRLDDDIASDLDTVSAVDGKPVAEIVRDAIGRHVASRKADPEFRKSLRDHISRVSRLLEI
jgi:predicted transcriptional regulator